MRGLAAFVVAALAANVLSAHAASPVEARFKQFGLFGNWALDCDRPAAPVNPHVRIAVSSDGTVIEEHDLGSEYAQNSYRVLAASKISATRLSVDVIFKPGAQGEERQKLIFRIGKGTRRTMFNQPDGGAVRVKDGVALGAGVETPVLKKCD